jgi:hypothetical protein
MNHKPQILKPRPHAADHEDAVARAKQNTKRTLNHKPKPLNPHPYGAGHTDGVAGRGVPGSAVCGGTRARAGTPPCPPLPPPPTLSTLHPTSYTLQPTAPINLWTTLVTPVGPPRSNPYALCRRRYTRRSRAWRWTPGPSKTRSATRTLWASRACPKRSACFFSVALEPRVERYTSLRALLGTASHFCGVVVLELVSLLPPPHSDCETIRKLTGKLREAVRQVSSGKELFSNLCEPDLVAPID